MSANAMPKRAELRRRISKFHRWLGLAAALIWLVQAFTGVLIVFHWEITDLSLPSVHRPTDLAAIEERVQAIAAASNSRPLSLWTTAGFADRYIVYLEEHDGSTHKVRIAGDGSIIEKPQADERGVMDILVGIHHNFLLGWGGWIVSISGILLCSNLILGLMAAWPKRGTWGLAMRPMSRGAPAARLYSWHRALGMWVAVPALIIVATGTLMTFEATLRSLIDAEPVSIPENPPLTGPVGMSVAARAGLAAIPGSTLTQVAWPTERDATYRIRVRAMGEIRRGYGGSFVFVDANDASVRGIFPISDAGASRILMNALFPVHTGEAGGLIGRLMVVATGLWLMSMIVIGVLLWRRRAAAGRAQRTSRR